MQNFAYPTSIKNARPEAARRETLPVRSYGGRALKELPVWGKGRAGAGVLAEAVRQEEQLKL